MICSHPKGLAGARAEKLVTGGMNTEALRVLDLPPFFHPAPACPHLLTLEFLTATVAPFVVMNMFQAQHKILLVDHLIERC